MRYFFDLGHEKLETLDAEGSEFASEAQMQGEARRILAEAAEAEARIRQSAILTARVRDGSGNPVYRVVLTLEGQRLQ
jgi:hypothetical protein